MNSLIEPRMYLILREDLAYKYIQGSHALAKFVMNYPELFQEWGNGYLICLSVFNGLALRDLSLELRHKGIQLVQFVEPDLESPLPTALCLFDNGKNKYREHLKGLPLASK